MSSFNDEKQKYTNDTAPVNNDFQKSKPVPETPVPETESSSVAAADAFISSESTFESVTDGASQTEAPQPEEQHWSYTPNFTLQPPVQNTADHSTDACKEPAPQPAYKTERKAPRKNAGIALLLVFCILFSGLAGFGGGLLAGNLNKPDTAVTDDAAEPTIEEHVIPQISVEEGLSYAELAALVSPTVVQITTEYTVENFWMQQTSTGAGSGVIISADGRIVTNHHVVEDATRIKVILSTGDEYDASLVASDAQTDIAVLKIDAADLPYASVGDSDKLVVGQEVIAVGNPLGELGGTVTNGIISALERQITVDDYTMTLLQTNTAINPGNSGGGLFDVSGKLIGVVNAKYSDTGVEGLGFAIPINTAMKSAQDLIDVGYVTGRVSVGLRLLDILNQQTAFQYRVSKLGVYVYSVSEGTSAERAGFRTGDLIVSVAGTDVYSADEVKSVFNSHEIGDVITVVVERNDEERELQLELTEYVPTGTQNT